MKSFAHCPHPIRRLPYALAVSLLLTALAASPAWCRVLMSDDTFSGDVKWEKYFQRDEISPVFTVSAAPSRGGEGSLGLYGASNANARGGWVAVVEGIEPLAHYSFEAFFTARGVTVTHNTVFATLEWQDAESGKIGNQREYVPEKGVEQGWRKVGGVFRAPEKAARVRIALMLNENAQARAWWDDVRLTRVPDPPGRKVRLATVRCRPGGNSTVMETVREFCDIADRAGSEGADMVCLGEGVNMIGVARPGGGYSRYSDIAEPIPGPTTDALGEVARRHGMYIVAALGEREEQAIYNTAVLIDREGKVAGKYRKVYIPEGEYDQGCSAGDAYPVFDTDFGRVGIMICWDSWFADPARALALQGAEIALLPIWGGNETLIRARAIENHIYLASCGYDVASQIIDPWGEILAEISEKPGVVYADIDLDYPPPCPYPWPLGDTRQVLRQALRNDITIPGLER